MSLNERTWKLYAYPVQKQLHVHMYVSYMQHNFQAFLTVIWHKILNRIEINDARCCISFYHHLPIRTRKVHLPKTTFSLAPPPPQVIFLYKVIDLCNTCPQHTFSLPYWALLFLGLSICLPNLTFTCPRLWGKGLNVAPWMMYMYHTSWKMEDKSVDF